MTDKNVLVLRFIDEVLRKGDFSAADQFLDADFAIHLPGSPEPIHGVEGLKRVTEVFRIAFPDRRVIVEDIISGKDKVAIRVTQEGTHKGAFQGAAPTGKQISVSAIAIFRIANGKVAEEWLSSDRLGLLQQIGAIATPASR
jgi:steroid delta-isomerase-like uncharacterized protein